MRHQKDSETTTRYNEIDSNGGRPLNFREPRNVLHNYFELNYIFSFIAISLAVNLG